MKQRPVGFIPMAQRPGAFTQPWRTMRTIGALMMREMTTTYGRSPGGYLWAFLEPVGSVLLLTIVISVGLKLRQPSLGVSFALFYATGMLVFSMYVRMQQKIAQSISYSRTLLRYPSVTFFDAIMARFLLNLLTQGAVMMVVFFGIMMIFETRANITMPYILYSMAMAASLAMGIGLVNAFLMPLFPVYASVFGIMTTPLFFTSGVLYLYEDLPTFAQDIIWYNPLIHITAMMRRGFYSQYDGEFISPAYVFSVSFVLALIGFILISRYFRLIVDNSY